MHFFINKCLKIIVASLLIQLPAVASGEEPTVPVFKDGEAQIVDGFRDPDYWIREDLWVETDFDSDGDNKRDRMHVAVTRPRQTETEGLKLPAIYISSPYFAGTGTKGREYFWDPKQELGEEPNERKHFPSISRKGMRPIISKSHSREWVPRGYAVVHSSSPGTGLSEGCVTIGGDNESLAPKAVVDWLCGRAKGFKTIDGSKQKKADWCTGKVGMTGTSFNGTLALAAATTGVDGLEVIIPIAPNTSYYHYYRSNGLIRHPYGFMGEDIDYLYDFVHSGGDEQHRNDCDCKVRDGEMLKQFDRVTGDYNDFWSSRDYIHDLKPVKAAVLMAHAFNDWNVVPEHSIRIYEALKNNGIETQLFMHQGGHGGPPPTKQMNRWFSHYLHGIDNQVTQGPRSWIVRETARRDSPTSYKDYPHPDSKPIHIFLQRGAPEHGTLNMNRAKSQGTETIIDNVAFDGTTLAKTDWTRHRLMYITPKLSQSIHISGTPKITIRLASDRPAVNLSVWLVSLPWNENRSARITDNIITRGWADPQNHRSLTESEPLERGTFYDVSFDLQPDDQIIPKDQQIGLMIFSSDRDYTLHPKPGTKLTVDLDATSLTLPVVGGNIALRQAFTPMQDVKLDSSARETDANMNRSKQD